MKVTFPCSLTPEGREREGGEEREESEGGEERKEREGGEGEKDVGENGAEEKEIYSSVWRRNFWVLPSFHWKWEEGDVERDVGEKGGEGEGEKGGEGEGEIYPSV